MKKKTTITLLLLLLTMMAGAKDIFVSTSFHEPATEGLRFIYSHDGIRWDSIQGVFLRPQVGHQKVMRDPSIVRSPDGTFHLVWTSSWRGDRGFGYASSRDLIHWSEQRKIDADEEGKEGQPKQPAFPTLCDAVFQHQQRDEAHESQ